MNNEVMKDKANFLNFSNGNLKTKILFNFHTINVLRNQKDLRGNERIFHNELEKFKQFTNVLRNLMIEME